MASSFRLWKETTKEGDGAKKVKEEIMQSNKTKKVNILICSSLN